MLSRGTLQRINNRPRRVNRLPLLAVGGGVAVLSAMLYMLAVLSAFTTLVILFGGVLVVLVIYAAQKAKTTISLTYEGNLDKEIGTRFSEVREALEALASSKKIRRLGKAARLPKAGEVLPTPEREPARVGLLQTPGIRANVPVWGIEAADESIFFFPEGPLLYKNDRYDPLSYKSLKVAFSSGRFFEEEDLPDDATVVERTWRFSRPDGSPDPRYKKDNVEIPIVLYGLVQISTPSGPKVRLEVSNRRAAARFASTFGAKVSMEDPKEKKARHGKVHRRADKDSWRSASKEEGEERRSTEMLETEARLATARRTLGVSKVAGVEEISGAYRKLARTHHPDKVANLEPEVREYSEQRMKEINAAYAEFKSQWNDPAAEGASVG